jgi:hypothetical protein
MQLIDNKLVQNLEKTNQYLSQKIDQEASYSNLIEEIKEVVATLETKKPLVKIVSRSATLAEKFQETSEANEILRSLYEFQIVSPIRDVRKIIKDCDAICLIYDSKQTISDYEKVLFEHSNSEKIIQMILVKNGNVASKLPIEDSVTISQWLQAQDYPQETNLLLPLDNFLILNSDSQINTYNQFLIQLLPTVTAKFKLRISAQVQNQIRHYFKQEKIASWKEIREIRELYTEGEYIDTFKSKIKQIFNKINQEQQQVFRQIKQTIHQSRGDLVNPFFADSLMCVMQQAIQDSEVKQIKEDGKTYLYLTIKKQDKLESIHSYIPNLCQQKLADNLTEQWEQINHIHNSGGLQELLKKIQTKLKIVGNLYSQEIAIASGKIPTFELAKTISPSTLKTNSRIVFDYHFTQSSWLRLFILVMVGCVFYLATKLISGTGNYFGFIIVIFQLINLFTGQDIKNLKLKQHEKELKRIVDSKYQVLIRFLTEKTVQTLITALDNENELYQEQINAIAIAVDEKLTEIKETVNQQKERIDNLKQDQSEILSWFE